MKHPPAARPLLQWGMAVLGALVTLFVVSVIVWEGIQPDRPPELRARIVAVAGQVAEIEVSNSGMDTAAAVDIEGVLGAETAKATVDYVPGRGHATAFLRFEGDPRAASVSVKGWSAP